MAEFKLGNASIVVLAESNNPRLLNPDFLERNKIVPKKWNSTNILVTPPYATVQYQEGLTIAVEESKLQFAADPDRLTTWRELLPNVAVSYLEVLPHVAYKAVGLNFTLLGDDPKGEVAEQILIANMLKQGEWLGFGGGMTGVNLELQFRRTQPHFSVKIGVRETARGQEKVLEGYVIVANYHHDFTPDQADKRAAYVRELPTKHDELERFVKQLPLRTN